MPYPTILAEDTETFCNSPTYLRPDMADPLLIDILGGIDHLLRHSTVTSLQDPKFAKHKRDTLSKLSDVLYNRYSVKEIDEKIFQVFALEDKWPQDNLDRLYQNGSSALSNLNTETRNHVERRMMEYEEAYENTQRQESQTLLRRSKRHCGDASKVSSRSKRQRPQRSQVLSGSRSESQPISKVENSPCRRRRSRKARTLSVPSRIEIEETPFQSPLSVASPLTHIVSPSERATAQNTHPGSAFQETHQTIEAVETKESVNAFDTELITNFDTIRYREMSRELDDCRNRCECAEEEVESLKMARRTMEVAKEIPRDLSDAITESWKKINKLKRRLDDRDSLLQWSSMYNDTQQRLRTEDKIYAEFQTLQDRLRRIFTSETLSKFSFHELWGLSPLLDKLLTVVFGTDISASTSESSKQQFFLNDMIQSLTGAAIFNWVFGDEYRPHGVSRTPLLLMYRKHIASIYGERVLQEIDLAAHKSIAEDETIRNLAIPHTSEQFTERLLQALEPLLERYLNDKAMRKLKNRLTKIMAIAVQARLQSQVGSEDYEVFWPSSGSPFLPDEMEATNTGSGSQKQSEIQLPICPGLRAYSKKPAMVEYQGLCNNEKRPCGLKRTVRALVLQ